MTQLTIGLLGTGTVGTGLLNHLRDQTKSADYAQFTVKKALVRNIAAKQALAMQYQLELTTDIRDIVQDPTIDIVVELLGKIEPARQYIKMALENGKHVVTANKDLMALHGEELIALAQAQGCDLYYEASVAGGIPILRTLAESYPGDTIQMVQGIVNGTTNYMLTQMFAEGRQYEEALQQAQELGFAESDPTNDVDGIDAAYKMILLGEFAFGMTLPFSALKIAGIRQVTLADVQLADQLGYVIKLLGTVSETASGIYGEVMPTLVAKTAILAAVQQEFNAVAVTSQGIGSALYYGPGAGAMPTAASVVSDLLKIAQNQATANHGQPFNGYHRPLAISPKAERLARYYLALAPEADPTQLTTILDTIGISLRQLIEGERTVLLTETISEVQLEELTTQLSSTRIQLHNIMKVEG